MRKTKNQLIASICATYDIAERGVKLAQEVFISNLSKSNKELSLITINSYTTRKKNY